MDTRNEKQKWRLFDCKTQERQEERVHTAFPPELASGNTAGVKKPGTSNRLGSRANEQRTRKGRGDDGATQRSYNLLSSKVYYLRKG